MKDSKADKTRRHIIEKVAPVFNKKGYAGTKVIDLIQATGLTKGSIYGNFKDKDEVALEAFRHNYKEVLGGTMAEMSLETDYTSKLKAIPQYYRNNIYVLAKLGGCPLLNTAIDSANVHPYLEKESVKAFRNYYEIIKETIEKGKQTKEFYPHVDPHQYAGIILSLIEGGIALSKSLKDPTFLMESLKKIDQIIDNELKA